MAVIDTLKTPIKKKRGFIASNSCFITKIYPLKEKRISP